MRYFQWFLFLSICYLTSCSTSKNIPYQINEYKGHVHTVYEEEKYFSEGVPSLEGLDKFYGVLDDMDIDYDDEEKDPDDLTTRVVCRLDRSGRLLEMSHLLADSTVNYNSLYEYENDKKYYHTVIRSKQGNVYAREILEVDKPGYHLFRTYNTNGEMTQETVYTWTGNKVTMTLYEENILRLKMTNYYKNGIAYKATSENQYSDSKTITLLTYNEQGDRVKEVVIETDGTRRETFYTYEYDAKGNWIKCVTTLENATTPCFITERFFTYYED